MRRTYPLLIILTALLFQFCEKDPADEKPPVTIIPPQSGKWRQMLDTNNVEIIQTAFFSIGDKGYTINPQTNEVYEYNATTNKVTKKGIFPGPRRESSATAFSIGNKGYYGLGLGQKSLKEGSQTQWSYVFRVDFWEYDTTGDSWTRKADCPIPSNGSNTASFFGAYGIAINNKGYIGSGRDNNFSIRRFLYEYEPQSDKWNAVATTTSGTYPPEYSPIVIAFSTGNKGYIGNSETLWEFDPSGVVKWKPVKSPPQVVKQPVLSLGSATKGYVFGSITSLNQLTPQLANDFYEYTPSASGGAWNMKDNFTGPSRASCPGFILNNKVYIGFGSNISAAVYTDMWEYTP